jgi:hypothetical protein
MDADCAIFDDADVQTTKARLEEDLARRRLEIARKDEEIARLQSQGSGAAQAVRSITTLTSKSVMNVTHCLPTKAAEARDAVARAEEGARAEREGLLRANADLRERLRRCEEELQRAHGELDTGSRRLTDVCDCALLYFFF